AVGVVALLWDHIITFPTELRLVWTRPFTGPKAVFLFLRYVVSGSQIVIAYVLLIMRLYALWDHRKRILQALIGGFILTYAASIIAFDVFVVLLSLINAADRPRGLNVKLLTDLRRDGWLFYLVR
ncbi:hypothetical protein DENSPDRAFT_741114, partial [Dentipellis sp. KUC8613]